MTTNTPAPAPKDAVLTTGQILSLERRSNMTDDEALRFGRAIESALLSKLRAPVACNCPGGNKPADLHAPNCPVRQTQAKLLDPYDGGTWLTSAPVADEGMRTEALYLLREARALLPLFTTAEAIGDWSEKVERFAADHVIDVPASAPVAGEATRRGKFLPEHVTQQMIWNVQAVIEGECGGLALDERQARNVMAFLMSEHGPDAAPQASEAQCSCPSGDGSLRHPCAVHGASEAVRDAQDATGRTPTAYALEFAEYLARDAEYVMACLNASQRANEALLDLTEEIAPSEDYQAAEDAAAQADEAFTEAITGLRSGIFEFRKRRDRAAPTAQPGAQKESRDA
ncbi:hypothetical protein [Achromobacter sp. UBA4530]|uniref:hypothetical protein n=1 Tax=Achromobacter sp. UBA4530 TaxID=1945912 RepID=UPI00257E4FD4|nr:hypothetical protein [Achromobacter sp. UBA4530]